MTIMTDEDRRDYPEFTNKPVEIKLPKWMDPKGDIDDYESYRNTVIEAVNYDIGICIKCTTNGEYPMVLHGKDSTRFKEGEAENDESYDKLFMYFIECFKEGKPIVYSDVIYFETGFPTPTFGGPSCPFS